MIRLKIFQSTRSQRPRHEKTDWYASTMLFQSTRSQRPRRNQKSSRKILVNFNPRGRKDLDDNAMEVYKYPKIFQSTRSQRPRHTAGILNTSSSSISIHEVAKTSTIISACKDLPYPFQSTRSQRPRLALVGGSCNNGVFQSTRSQRPRQGRKVFFSTRPCISIHEVAKTSTNFRYD